MKPTRLDYWRLDIAQAQKAYEQDKIIFHAIRTSDYMSILSQIAKGAYIHEKFFELCITYNDLHLIVLMIDKYEYLINVSKPFLSKLCMKYVSHRNLILYILSRCGVSSMYDLFDPLVHASIHGDIDMIQMLTTRFAFAHDILYSPFFWAAKSGHLSVVAYILDVCKNIDEIHMSNTLVNVVHDCCSKGSNIYIEAPIIKLLARQRNCTLFHCVEKCYEKKNAFILALLIPYLSKGVFANESTANILIASEALKMKWAVRRIGRALKIHRRLLLAKTLYKAMNQFYSPSIVEIVAKHGSI